MAKKASANDYAEHEATYHAFLKMTKMAVVSLIFTVLALYCFIFAGLPWLGLVLLLVSVPAAVMVDRSGSAS